LKKSNHILKRIKRGGLIAPLFFALVFQACNETAPPQKDSITSLDEELKQVPRPYNTIDWDLDQAQQKLQAGDIILKCGKGHISNLILQVLDEPIPLSHCAILIERNDSLRILHSVSSKVAQKDGVQLGDLPKFLSDLREGTFYALRHKDSSTAQQIGTIGLKSLNNPAPFDDDYNHHDTTELYCSELVRNVLLKANNKEYFGIHKIEHFELISFNEILASDDFEILNKKAN